MHIIKGCDVRYHRHYEIPILFESCDYIIIDKPFNLRIDGPTENSPTCESHLQQVYGSLYLVHQLDFVTSGVHCWAKSSLAASKIGKLFIKKRIKKTYVALVKGHVVRDDFEMMGHLYPDPEDALKMKCDFENSKMGKESKTIVHVLERGYFQSLPVTHVVLYPLTGRKHQLRVQLASIGHAILGDDKYDLEFKESDTFHPLYTECQYRTMLHALEIEIPLDPVIHVKTIDPFKKYIQNQPCSSFIQELQITT